MASPAKRHRSLGHERVLADLRRTLGALRVRLRVLSADPTCRWAQEENLSVIGRLADEAAACASLLDPAPGELRPEPGRARSPHVSRRR